MAKLTEHQENMRDAILRRLELEEKTTDIWANNKARLNELKKLAAEGRINEDLFVEIMVGS